MSTKAEQAQQDLKVVVSDTPSHFVDGVLGHAVGNGVYRILFAEYVVDPTIGAELPGVRHAVNLVMTPATAKTIITYLKALPGVDSDD